MELRTRTSSHQQPSVNVQHPVAYRNDDGLKEHVRAMVIKGLNPNSRNRVAYQAKIPLTILQAEELKRSFNLGYRLINCSLFMEEFRIVRATFSTYDHFCKIKEDSFKVAIRNSRAVYYYSRGRDELKTKSIQPPPYMVIAFKREFGRLNID